MSDNPFERYGLDPRDGPQEITARLRALIEDATDDAEREAIRSAWEALTMHPGGRLDAALAAHPETRPPVGTAPRPIPRPRRVTAQEPRLLDLVSPPSVEAAIAGSDELALPDCPMDEDPVLIGDPPCS